LRFVTDTFRVSISDKLQVHATSLQVTTTPNATTSNFMTSKRTHMERSKNITKRSNINTILVQYNTIPYNLIHKYEGRSINKLQNSVTLLVF